MCQSILTLTVIAISQTLAILSRVFPIFAFAKGAGNRTNIKLTNAQIASIQLTAKVIRIAIRVAVFIAGRIKYEKSRTDIQPQAPGA